MGALEEEDDDIYEVEKKQDYDRSVTDDGGGQFGWTGPHSMGERWTMECFMKANKTSKPAKVCVRLSIYLITVFSMYLCSAIFDGENINRCTLLRNLTGKM